MKMLLGLTLSLFSYNSFARIDSAPEKFLNCVPVGEYSGVTQSGVACHVSVIEANYPKRDIQVQVQTDSADLTKLIDEDSDGRYIEGQRRFSQVDTRNISSDSSKYVQRTLSTNMVDTNKQLVVIEYTVNINRDSTTQTAECTIDL